MNQEAIDLFIPVFLKGKQKCWAENPIVPLFGERPAKLKWKHEHLAKVRDTFTGILVQVRNNQAGSDKKKKSLTRKCKRLQTKFLAVKSSVSLSTCRLLKKTPRISDQSQVWPYKMLLDL
jgi:hypothetical protein